jgi:hypothetical protein
MQCETQQVEQGQYKQWITVESCVDTDLSPNLCSGVDV